jgi:hypothetical protein
VIKRGAPFEDRFVPEPNSGCWLWIGAQNNKGYGVISAKRGNRWKVVLASRFSYEKHRGSIPPGLCVLHKCDTPICVNPDHLFVGTKRDNTDDALRKGRMHRGETSGSSKLKREQVLEIRSELAKGATHSSLAKRFDVSRPHITRIANRQYWPSV